jgi:hypothetical protein
MLNPYEADPDDQPFSYYAHPTDPIGAMYAPNGNEVTPEGYVYTGFGELMFLTGNPPMPIACRIKRLHQGYLPIVEFACEREGVRYAYQLFAADLGGTLAGMPVNFARVTATNVCGEERTAFCSAACRYHGPSNTAYGGGGDFRVGSGARHIPKELLDSFDGPQAEMRYGFGADAVRRNGKLVYLFPASPRPHWKSVALMDSGTRLRRYFSGEIEGDPDPVHRLAPDEPAGIVTHALPLPPGETRSLVYVMPMLPVAEDSEGARLLRKADYDELLQQTIAFWEDFVVRRACLHFPEAKVQEYLLANTIVNLLACDRVGADLYPTVNKFQYHSFYGGGNVNDIMRSLEYMGHTDVCREGVLFLARQQQPDGSFRLEFYPEGMWWEMWGYNLWGLWRHYDLTRDGDFLQQVYPVAVRGMAWQAEIASQDPEGLWPPATIADDAYLKNCRQTGQCLWGLVGLRSAMKLAQAMGNQEDLARFTRQHDDFRAAFDRLLALQTAQTGGYIPPALERTTAGNDWDNLLLLYPELLFDPMDERVGQTLEVVRGKYQEGVLGYTWPCSIGQEGAEFIFNEQPGLHYWQTPNNTQTSLVRGTPEDQQWAVREVYAMLLHSSSTHMIGEFGTIPWSTRDCSHVYNLIPQGTSAAKLIEAMRNMLVREQEQDLWLLSALSPEWVKPGKVMEVVEEPTSFGPVSLTLRADDHGLSVEVPQSFRDAPEHVFLRVPWFWQLDGAQLDGEAVTAEDAHIAIPVGAKTLRLIGRINPNTPELSYEQAVADYKAEYRRRWELFLRTGKRE